jgi:osmotically-inducible protein OsmY
MSEWNRNDRGQMGGGRDREGDFDDWRRRQREQREWERGAGSGSSGEDRSFGAGGQPYGQQADRGYGDRSQGYGAQRNFGGYDTERFGGGSRLSDQDRDYAMRGSGGMSGFDEGRGSSMRGGQGRSQGGGQMFGDPNEEVRAVADGDYEPGGFMGVGKVLGQHRGKGPKNYTRSDDRIREDVNDRLADDSHIDASEIEVQVKECEVTLSGTVNSREEKRYAEDIVDRISGVKHVQNNLRIQGQQGGGMSGTSGETRNFGGSTTTGQKTI